MHSHSLKKLALLGLVAGALCSCGNSGNKDTIRIGLECAYIPFNWVAKNPGEFTLPIQNHPGTYADGYDIQIAKRIAKQTGKKVEIVQTNWEALITDLQMRSIDAIIAGMTDTEARRKQISFTDEYYRSELVLITSKAIAQAHQDPLSASDFKTVVNGQNVVSQVSTVTDEVIDVFASDYGAKHVTPVATFALAAQDVVNGSSFAMTAELPVARSIVSQYAGLGILHIDQAILGEYRAELGVSIGVRKDDTELQSQINGVLATIDAEERLEIMEAAVQRSAGVEA